jgi:hypothetical protein
VLVAIAEQQRAQFGDVTTRRDLPVEQCRPGGWLVVTGLALLGLMGARVALRRWRFQRFLSRGTPRSSSARSRVVLAGGPDNLLPTTVCRRIAGEWRRRRPSEIADLAVRETVLATAANGNCFRAVHRPRSTIPEYLVLIERRSRYDLQTAWFAQWMQQLAREGLHLSVYYFDGDLRIAELDQAIAAVEARSAATGP